MIQSKRSLNIPPVPASVDIETAKFLKAISDEVYGISRRARLDLEDANTGIADADSRIAALEAKSFLPCRLGSIVSTPEEITLSATEPYFNLASPSQNLNAANFIDYVPFLRAIMAGTRWTSAVLTGTVTLAGTALTGSSTNFDPEIAVGDIVFIEKLNQFRYIATRTSDTAATVDEPGTAAAGARIWKITRAVNKTTTFPITSYQITAANAFSLWMNEGSTTKKPENYILMRALAEAYAYDREYGTLTLPEAIGGIPAGDYQITGITLANVGSSSAVITCSATGLTPGAKTASSANISIYPHRIAGSTTTARHKELTDAALTNDGLYNVLGLAQRDAMQGHYHSSTANNVGTGSAGSGFAAGSGQTLTAVSVTSPSTDGTNGPPRTGPRTRPRSGIFNFYAYVGTYTV